MRWVWRCLALVAVALGLIGVIVPGMPTTVFMLMGAAAASRGWPALHDWLLSHPRFGPPIQHWRNYGAVPRKAKWMALITMLLSMWMICSSATALWVKWSLPSLMSAILLWLWTRPECPRKNPEQEQ
ncbi:YbaN family protein [Cellvibrio japonicus]|uniref:Inner membrane protein n=1 Tax=Cellvibrio japonicus (strain Ueda107) TaxID=498211 RepID=B3PLR2_CELJU|nr:YbaN family protein [Cellvibrio japonicus]ACE86301.1 putative membrane protein [Cellvibrio japonicus Ueda107]QEI13043.1 DUF454 domain-containing protein [Cellvibrio japonicus]QEI16617.1 DUF454 domain-containing protein [Cellvibrio japonicus]QEI20195.1 DUF454 domain-containing protein [Cellvibrio japonicus]